MIRRNTRLRKEYLYRKSLEGKESEIYEKKRKIRKALAEGKPIPTELRDEELELRRLMEADDSKTADVFISTADDEYGRAGITDPRIFISTSRDPSSRLMQFQKELALIIPNAQKKNRGGHQIKELVEACRSNDITDLILIHEHRGEPDTLIISHFPYGPTAFFSLSNVVLRHDINEKAAGVSTQFPHLIFHGFSTKLGERTQNILKYIFPVPKEDSKRVFTFANQSDYISFRHHVFQMVGPDVVLKEVGPRFEMKLYQIKLGTVDVDEADKEWVYRPYLNTAKQKNYL